MHFKRRDIHFRCWLQYCLKAGTIENDVGDRKPEDLLLQGPVFSEASASSYATTFAEARMVDGRSEGLALAPYDSASDDAKELDELADVPSESAVVSATYDCASDDEVLDYNSMMRHAKELVSSCNGNQQVYQI